VRLIAGALVVVLVALAGPAGADHCAGLNGAGVLVVECAGSHSTSPASGVQSPGEGSPGGGGRVVDPLLMGRVVNGGTLPGGGACVSVGLREFGSVEAAENENRVAFRRLENSVDPACPPAPGAPPVVLPSPEEVALAFWRQVELPTPQPAVAPGWAITGLPSYLEPGTTTTVEETFDTVLGPLTITATGAQVGVDWGDGTTAGPVPATLGGPYPDGGITHVYTDVGTVTITVTQYWEGTWSLPGQGGGTFATVTRTTPIEGFEVRQVQAVLG